MTEDLPKGLPGDLPEDHDEQRVRALLGSLGPAEPMPSDVLARIETAIGAEGPLELAPPPRSRVPRRWLAAAAALVVIGGGGAILVQHLTGSGDANTASASGESTSGSRSQTQSLRKAPSTMRSSSPVLPGPQMHGRVALPTLTTAHFAAGVHSLLSHAGYAALRPLAGAAMPEGSATGKPDCTRPAGVGGASIIEISLDGALSQLVVTGSGADRVATAYDCSGTRRLVSAAAPG